MRFAAAFGVALLSCPVVARPANPPPPFLTDPAALPPARVGADAEHAVAQPIVTVVDKPRPSPTGDPHDYVSYARYWWPDPTKPDGLPYVQHDGRHNEAMVRAGDEPRLGAMEHAVHTLALGWAVTHRESYARRAGDWLRAWFIARATRMKPNLDFAQIRLGRDNNRNIGTGCLDGRGLTEVIDALGLLRGSPALSASETATVNHWMATYCHWLLESPAGLREHCAPNNHGTWYLVQAVALARYVGDEATARRLCLEDLGRIAWQIEPDGSQPEELRRQDGLGYSVFNLSAQLELSRLALPLGIDLVAFRAPAGGSLPKAIAYLRPYDANPKTWPGRQHNPMKPGFLRPIDAQLAELRRAPAASASGRRVGVEPPAQFPGEGVMVYGE